MSSSSSNLPGNVLVVVRSSHERTEALCIHLAKQQVPEEHVVVIHERPFSQALKRSFEIGLDFGLDWTLALDADLLICPSAIGVLKSYAENMPSQYFGIQGNVLDKLLGFPRPVGHNFYRTIMFRAALRHVSDSEDQIRPETHIKKQMESRGFPSSLEPILFGIHDYEQYYRDIYRKCIVHAHKFSGTMPYSTQLWQLLSPHDMDYRVALWGYRAGQAFDGAIKIDRASFPEEIDVLLRLLECEEKTPIDEAEWVPATVAQIIEGSPLPALYSAWRAERAKRRTLLGKMTLALEEYGWLRLLPWIASKGLYRVAGRFERLAQRPAHKTGGDQ